MIRNELTAQVMIKKGEIVLVLHNSKHEKQMLLVFLTMHCIVICTQLHLYYVYTTLYSVQIELCEHHATTCQLYSTFHVL